MSVALVQSLLVGQDHSRHLALEADRERLLTMLSIVAGRPISATQVLDHVDAAALIWRRGDKALANLRLVFSSLPRLADRNAVNRLALAEEILDEGTSPIALLKALWPDTAPTLTLNYDPEQPRVPAGHGADSGRWKPSTGTGSDRNKVNAPPIRVAENDDPSIASVAMLPKHDEVVHDASAVDPPRHHPSTLLDPLTELPAGVGPGKFAVGSVAAGPTPRPRSAQQSEINEKGAEFGCHTCGTKSPGTPGGNWVGDHRYPTSLVTPGAAQRYFPQCLHCSRIQGGLIRALKSRGEVSR